MMKFLSWRTAIAIGFVATQFALTSSAQAQLFGNRTIGTPAGTQGPSPFGTNSRGGRVAVPSLGSPATGQPAAGGAGPLDGNERFVRGNRSRQDFVGTARNDLSGFVGSGQAIGVGRVPAASDSFRLEATSAARINKPLPKQPAKGMYYPRLVLEPSNAEIESIESTETPANQAYAMELQRRVINAGGANIEVVVAGNTVVLKGSVDSKRTAELIANVLSFEPGIDRVDNQLAVR